MHSTWLGMYTTPKPLLPPRANNRDSNVLHRVEDCVRPQLPISFNKILFTYRSHLGTSSPLEPLSLKTGIVAPIPP